MADEAIIRLILVEGGKGDSSSTVDSPEPPANPPASEARSAESASRQVTVAAQTLQTSISALTTTVATAARAIAQVVAPVAATARTSAVPVQASPYEQLREMRRQNLASPQLREFRATLGNKSSTPEEVEYAHQGISGVQKLYEQQIAKIFQQAKLTPRQSDLANELFVKHTPYSDLAEAMDVDKSRIAQLAKKVQEKLEIYRDVVGPHGPQTPGTLRDLFNERTSEGVERAAQDQTEAGKLIEYAKDPPAKGKYNKRLAKRKKEYNRLVAAWEKANKSGDTAKASELAAAVAKLGAVHMASGGDIFDDPLGFGEDVDVPGSEMSESQFDLPPMAKFVGDETTDYGPVKPYGASYELSHHAEGGMLDWFAVPGKNGGPSQRYEADLGNSGYADIYKDGDEWWTDLHGKPGAYVHATVEEAKANIEQIIKTQLDALAEQPDWLPEGGMPELYHGAKGGELSHYADGGDVTGGINWNMYYGGTGPRQRPYLAPFIPAGVSAPASAHMFSAEYGRAIAIGDPDLGYYIRRNMEDTEYNLWYKRHKLASADTIDELKERIRVGGDLIHAIAAVDFAKESPMLMREEGPDPFYSEPGPYQKHYRGGGDLRRGGRVPWSDDAPAGTDWQRIYAMDGEFMVNQKSAARNRNALMAANADPEVTLTAHHMARGGNIPWLARQLQGTGLFDAGTPGVPQQNVPVGPPSPPIVGTPPSAAYQALELVGGPIGQAIEVAAHLVVEAEQKLQEAAVGAARSLGEITNTFADPNSNPALAFTRMGDALTSGGEKVSGALNFAVSPIASMLGIDLFPQLKLLTGVSGELAKQFGALMDNVKATADRYAEYSPAISQAQAMVDIQNTLGELRRSRESGPELARYLRAQGDLQQKYEDLKMKVLVKILPLITAIVDHMEKLMPAGDNIAAGIGVLVTPLVALAEAANGILGLQQADRVRDPEDPTALLFQQPGALQGQGVGVPQQ